ncbi:EamA family transporter RarD [Qingshengfaniella alkalisoli]|uniref:EamA family transporter RarD n=1 Tax=Qingshengfaniella alkalisoli TaxID=2599296 RepID=A0A5B8J3W0_9RHOB|nr:EamA family transporter RarD [Qingshengfaniella alkalisoli]QDY68980.1 EamA family transporter RarD [Qingshengfaniella alkalisoli]
MSDTMRGLYAIIGACLIWGLGPLYYKLLAPVPPLEILAHRTIWSLVFFGAILAVRGRLSAAVQLIRARTQCAATIAAAFFISANWFGFILSVQIARALESSLGYFIFPLVAVLLGMIFFGDRLNRLQWLSVALAALAVGVLIVGVRAVPWIALGLAFSFGIYGLLKKRVRAEAMVSVTVEMLVLSPLALFWLWGVHAQGFAGLDGRVTGGVFGKDAYLSALLALSGPLTALPLILFSYASQRLSLPTVGLIQYLNPSLQFLCAAVVFGEPLTRWHMLAFPLIWVALAVYSFDAFRKRRSRSIAASVDSTTVNFSRREGSANP